MKYKYGGTKNKVGPKFGKNQIFILKCSEGWGHQGDKGNIPQKNSFPLLPLVYLCREKLLSNPDTIFHIVIFSLVLRHPVFRILKVNPT